MTVLLSILALALAAGLIYLARLPGTFEIRRALPMRVDRERAFDYVRDLRRWSDWSPWLMHEPDARLTYSGDPCEVDGSYSWDGQRIGAGTLTHVRLDRPARIEQHIAFVRPFKSQGDVWWEFAERDGQTEVAWGMRGSMPFFLRFLIPFTTRMVEKDYDLGLARMRGALDPQSEYPSIRFLGEVEQRPRTALTIPFAGGLPDLIAAMRSGFQRLAEHLNAAGQSAAGPAFAAYHKADSKKMYFECDIAVSVADGTPSGPFALKRIGGGRCYAVELRGQYDFLELAWHSAMAHVQMCKLKYDRSRPALEIYESDPSLVSSTNELVTRIEVPIR